MLKAYCPKIGVHVNALLSDLSPSGANLRNVTSCSSDARFVKPGDLYVAIEGPDSDGHAFIREAIRRGANAILTETPMVARGIPVCVVSDTREAYGRICQELAGSPADHLCMIAVTGTSGKTITASLISAILNEAELRTGLLGTLGYCDSFDIQAATYTTPTPPVLAQWLSRMEAAHCSHAVVEVSSESIAQNHLAGVSFDTVCFTNIDRAHLDFHNTVENYRQVKQRLLNQRRADALVVLNADDPNTARLISEIDGPALTVGIEQPADVTATIVERSLAYQTFMLHAGEETACVRTRMIGDFHVYNCLVAAAVGLANGVDLLTIARALESLDNLEGRMERIDCGQEYAVFVDAAETPLSVEASIKTLKELTPGELICVYHTEGKGDRDTQTRIARMLEKMASQVIITASPTETMPKAWVAADFVGKMELSTRAVLAKTEAEGAEFALSIAKPGDTVLFIGRDDSLRSERNLVEQSSLRKMICALLYKGFNRPTCRQAA